jgi:hypothetical protein
MLTLRLLGRRDGLETIDIDHSVAKTLQKRNAIALRRDAATTNTLQLTAA